MAKKHKILIIEDEPSQVVAIKTALEGAGFSVESADDGKEGLAKAKKTKYDLILLDIVLPKMDGIEVLKELKKIPGSENVPVLMLTNLASGETIRQAVEAGSTDYLVKTDYTLDDLTRKIKEALKGRE